MCSRFVTTNKPLREPASRGKIWVKPTDQMDLWLDSQGYYRKHTAKDGSCLYRAVSEQIFLAQAFHLDVRRQCAEYAHRHPELLSNVTHCTVDEYVDHMKHPHELGGKVELQVMSLMFRRDFLVFYEVGKNFQQATDNGFKDRIMLCLSQDRHYDSVYTKQFISNAAFCQSLVYETLYKGVFELLEVDYAVKKMLHDKSSKYQRDSSSFLMNGLALRLEIRDSYFNVKDLLTLGVTPFPYKVAKSLDPDIYRNVEYDTWNDIRRGLRYGMYMWNNRELQVGVKCLVKLQPDRVCHAHIQDMAPNKGPVVVFVEELGEKVTVDYESLELLPQPPQPPSLPLPLKQLRQLQTIKALTHDMLPHEDIGEKDLCTESLTVSNSDKDDVWRLVPESDGKAAPKLKMFAELSKPSKRSSKAFRTKTKDLQLQSSTDSVKNQAEANSVVSSSDCNYQQQDVLNYQQESFEEYNSQGYMQQDVEEEMEQKGTEIDSSTPPTVLCLEPQHYYIPSTESYPHPAYCYVPHKPEDIAPLRFYYNYGVDHYSRGIRPTPPCYLNTTVAYMPDPNISPGIYEHASPISTPDSAVVMSPVGVYTQRPDSLPVLHSPGGVSLNSEPDSTTYSTQNIAPRFKNKIRAMQGRPYDPPMIQQPEVSSTTNIPVPTHYIPPASAPAPATAVYYHPVECEPYCPPNYVEYTVYDPTVFYPPPPSLPPTTHYIHPETLFYQHIVPAPLPTVV